MTGLSNASLAARIARASRLQGEFVLRSGAIAAEYFDKYRFESDPVLLAEVAESLAHLIPQGVDALAGLELGGVPLVTAMSLRTGLPALFVRKTPKEYGTAQLAEGGETAGKRLLVVEDVVTSGGQLLESCKALRQLGATVGHALCVIDRLAGGREALSGAGIELISLFTKDGLDEAERGRSASTVAESFLRSTVTIRIDRPMGSVHPRESFVYPVNYGFVPGVPAPDGGDLDAYVLGVFEPVDEFTGTCIAVIHRTDDDDDKLVVVPPGRTLSNDEIRALTEFQERWFTSVIQR